MDISAHTMGTLFAQLGQASDAGSIAQFIQAHSPLPGYLRLHEAGFWTSSQSSFLREAMLEDGEWSDVVDQLNRELHSRH